MTSHNKTYELEEEYDPQSRFDNIPPEIEPEFWKHKMKFRNI